MPKCLECKKPLPMSVPWQRFCTKKKGKKSPGCANRYNFRKWYAAEKKRKAKRHPKRG